MATLEIKDKSIDFETNSIESYDYYANIVFNTEESKNTDRVKTLEIPLKGSKRSDMTFGEIQEQITEYFEEQWPNLEIVELKRVNVEERTTIKKRPIGNYQY